LRRWLAEPMTIHRRLQTVPPLVTERLRDCQIDAVRNLEASLASDHPRALIQMATGAGKTYTACVFSHRLLDHAKFRRVLFLADRANLVRQTRHEFEDFRLPGHRPVFHRALQYPAARTRGSRQGRCGRHRDDSARLLVANRPRAVGRRRGEIGF